MARQGKATATPRLRFPEFRGTSDWTTIELRQIAELVTERVGATDCVPYTITSGVGLVSQQEKLGRTIAGNSLKNYIQLQGNDFAYNKSATKAFPQGFIARYVGDERAAVPNSIFTCFRTKEGVIDPVYLDGLFSTNLHGSWLRSRIAVGARAHGSLNVSDEDLMALPVPLPSGPSSLTEQQKIADCLTSLDEVISAQGRRVETLKAHKRGLMQQLFPFEGETRPRLRYAEFRSAPVWEEITIGDLGEVITGNTPATSHGEYYGGGRHFVSPADISDSRFIESTRTTLSETGFSQARAVKAGSVLFVCIGSTIGKVAQNACECATNQQINAVVVNANFSEDFVYYLLDMESARIAGLAGRQAVPIINKTQFSSVKLLVPGPEEQQRIAEILASLDTRIAAESRQLAGLKAHKQGLMQQLFPAREVAHDAG